MAPRVYFDRNWNQVQSAKEAWYVVEYKDDNKTKTIYSKDGKISYPKGKTNV